MRRMRSKDLDGLMAQSLALAQELREVRQENKLLAQELHRVCGVMRAGAVNIDG